MSMKSLIIITDERRVGGMLMAARTLSEQVIAVVVGSPSLAETVATWGFERVLNLEPASGIPAEAYAALLAEVTADIKPRLILASDMPSSRVLLAAVAAKQNAAIIGAVRAITVCGDTIITSRSMADDKVLEDIKTAGVIAGIFIGDDLEKPQTQAVAIEHIEQKNAAHIKLKGIIEPEGNAGLLTAARVVSVGSGIKAKNDIKLIEELAQAAQAEIGCTLPICDDVRWLPTHRVVGSTHNQIAPELYIAIGISGQPQHLAGVRDAKIVVAINNDPEARILKNCNYGIVGDLYKIVPALTAAFKNLV
ncbi:MAG: electron transfer flavoprotein subunit alpha/FixB family protein [Firmicutes bacterium]|nr:electron transfer flavoprotein subunit alpha/FixB family protein [Bacillota bacterium]